jgi:hypothetical protein
MATGRYKRQDYVITDSNILYGWSEFHYHSSAFMTADNR